MQPGWWRTGRREGGQSCIWDLSMSAHMARSNKGPGVLLHGGPLEPLLQETKGLSKVRVTGKFGWAVPLKNVGTGWQTTNCGVSLLGLDQQTLPFGPSPRCRKETGWDWDSSWRVPERNDRTGQQASHSKPGQQVRVRLECPRKSGHCTCRRFSSSVLRS